MSRRHDRSLLPISDPELTAHARAERQRVRAALSGMSAAGANAVDLDEPGVGFRAPHHHDPEHARHRPRRDQRHWKQAFWKRRTAMRRERARQELLLRSA